MRSRAGEGGFTLIEVMTAAAVLSVGVVGVLFAVAASDKQDEQARQQSIAIDAARRQAEKVSATSFSQVFATWDDDPTDDPGGAGTAPGAWFAVAGLTPVAGDAQVGKVIFPVVAGAPGVLREDASDAAIWQLRYPSSDPRTALLGMPRDLDGDGVVQSGGVQQRYTLLPALITLRWQTGGGGEDGYALRLLLSDRSGGS